MKALLFILLLTSISICEQWYMPDSNLISDKEFIEKVTNDRTCFKFVKYFTPHCPYCRYLKAVFDTLKHQKQWCFQIYQLNCQWYPQFCRDNVRSPSFPYTVIYDHNGNLFEEIHGFYPENIIGAIFARIEDECLKIKNGGGQQQTQKVQNTNTQSSLSAQSHVEPIQYKEVSVQPSQPPTSHEQVQASPAPQAIQAEQSQPQAQPPPQSSVHNEANTQQPQRQTPSQQEQSVRQTQQTTTTSRETQVKEQKQEMPSYLSYIFYGVCIIVAGIYVRHLHQNQQHNQQHSPSPQQPESQDQKAKETKVPQKKSSDEKEDQDSELIELQDDQL